MFGTWRQQFSGTWGWRENTGAQQAQCRREGLRKAVVMRGGTGSLRSGTVRWNDYGL